MKKSLFYILTAVLGMFFLCVNNTFAHGDTNNAETTTNNTETHSHKREKEPLEIPWQQSPLQKTLNKYILQMYKLQGDKILDELDANLEKVASTKEAKLEAYSHIQATLRLKKEALDKDVNSNKTAKKLLNKYIDYMIDELEGKKKKL